MDFMCVHCAVHIPGNIHRSIRQTIQVNPKIDGGILCVKLVDSGTRPICRKYWKILMCYSTQLNGH